MVTGATGFLGSHLCRSLNKMASDVHAVSRKPQPANDLQKWWQGDLSDFATTQTLLNEIQPDVIFHLTAHAWGGPGLELVRPTLHNDLIATVNLLTAATELKVRRVVLTGSLEEPQSGGPEVVPSSPYAAAKWASGAYARMFYQLYRTPAVIVRIFMTYGPGQPAKKLIPYTILSLLNGEAPKLSDGQRLIDWIYVDDVIEGLLTAAQASDLEGSTIDVGSGSLISIRDIVEHLVNLVRPEVRPLFGAAPPRAMEPVRAANVKDTLERVGWKPAISREQGLELTVDWYKAQFMKNASGFHNQPA
ncbi:MAG: NAD(P)-dependent oxidoreductase [Candidatus Binatia bacterium]